MAGRFFVKHLGFVVLSTALVLVGCATSPPPDPQASSKAVAADPELVAQAAVMRKTILEGTLAGAAAGGGISISVGGNSDDVGTGISLGGLLGASAGTYVAHIQRRYVRENRRLQAVREDLDRNSEEVAATIAVMRSVLAAQQAQLAAAEVPDAAGATPDLEAEITQARANLAEMERAVEGASSRQQEFNEVRGLVPNDSGGSAIDPALSDLSQQIAEMRAIADSLANSL